MPAVRWIAPLLIAAALLAPPAPAASAAPVPAAAQPTPRAPRVGGPVRSAWPEQGRRPRTRLARWLARQVGPRRVASAAAAKPIELLRSYDIPRDDPSYDRLLNWAWTYDSAVAAAALVAAGERRQSTRLLDQLAALQRTDGAIEPAFNVSTGETARRLRSGTVAWLGLAAVTYDAAFDSDRYRDTAERAARFLLALERPGGLIAGGPDVTWVSTQHNLVAYTMIERLGDELARAGETKAAGAHHAAAAAIGAAIDAKLLVEAGGGASFRQGLGDDTRALDTQAIGAMYLIGRSRPQVGRLVLAGAERAFAIGGRSIELSGAKATYNQTYAARGPFVGYRPFLGERAPDVLWFEGTAEMRLAHAAFGDDTGELDASMARWAAITAGRGEASLGADRTVTAAGGDEYHVWPSGAAAAWWLLSAAAPAFFVAPLPDGTKLVTDWTVVRGDEQEIRTFPDGRVDMLTGSGDRRVLAGSEKLRDYTVTVDAELRSGSGYGIHVRTTTDDEELSSYTLLFDRTGGTIALQQVDDDRELKVPLASMRPPAGFDWTARHRTSVTVAGDGLTASVDGQPVLEVPRLAATSAAAAKASGVGGVSTPAFGRYGLRARSDAHVSFEQFTVDVGR